MPSPVHLGAVLCLPLASGHGPTYPFLCEQKPYSACSLWVQRFPQTMGWGDPKSLPYQTRQKSNHLWGALLCIRCLWACVHWGLSVAWKGEHTCHRPFHSSRVEEWIHNEMEPSLLAVTALGLLYPVIQSVLHAVNLKMHEFPHLC